MAKRRTFLLLTLYLLCNLCALPQKAERHQSNVPLADPFILLDGDTYYAYGTLSEEGIACYTSKDLKIWRSSGLALRRENTSETRWFWAPEVYHIGDKYIMYYSANTYLYAATSSSPLGPFVQVGKKPLMEGNAIDGTLFIDSDGSPWLFYVRFHEGNEIWSSRLKNDFVTLLPATSHRCLHTSQSWEEGQTPKGDINEGPCVWKYKGTYFLTYSANDYQSPNYGVGVATSKNLSGPWTKWSGNPVLQKRWGLQGVGHHSFFIDKSGYFRIVFHAHHDASNIHPRMMYIGEVKFHRIRGGQYIPEVTDSLLIPQ